MAGFKLFLTITVVELLFLIAIIFDLSPFLRGPAPYPPDWRWAYYFVNTLDKIWLVLLVSFILIVSAYKLDSLDNKKLITKEKIVLFGLVSLNYCLQISLLYFSRSGVGVLLARIISPDFNGYFTTATYIQNLGNFLRDYNMNVLTYPMHAQGHPPGSVLLFYFINQLVSPFSFIMNSFSYIPEHVDIRFIWLGLGKHEQLGAVISAGLIPFLASICIIPVYYFSKAAYGVKTAFRAAVFYSILPNVLFFLPLSDIYFPIFSSLTILLLIIGIQGKSNMLFFLSGVTISLGVFHGLSLLPILSIAGFYILFDYLLKRTLKFNELVHYSLLFGSGFLLLPILLLIFFNFNFIEITITLMSGLPEHREYFTWIFYNLYDFFIFTGLPIFLLFSSYLVRNFSLIRTNISSMDTLFLSFIITLLILNFSGAVRGEVARIWLPFSPFIAVFASSYITRIRNFSSHFFIGIVILQITQVIIMQEFWVMLW